MKRLAIVVGLAGAVFLLRSLAPHRPIVQEIPFDAARWKAFDAHPEPLNLRLQMLSALVRDYQLVGMSRPDVLELLGPPSFDGQFPGYMLGRIPENATLSARTTFRLYLFFDATDRVMGFWSNPVAAGTIPAGFKKF